MTGALLVQPSSGSWSALQGLGLPLSILHAAAGGAQSDSVRLMDLRGNRGWRRDLARRLQEEQPRLVGVTVMIGPQIAEAIDASRIAKAVLREVTVVWGGAFPTLCPELVLSEPSVDAAVAGEGEATLVACLDALRDGGSLDGVPNVVLREEPDPPKEGGGTVGRRGSTGVRLRRTFTPSFLDLDALPPVPYHLLDRARYVEHFKGGGVASLETSRGCPHRCSFCYNANLSDSHWRWRSPERVARDTDDLIRSFAPEAVFVMDDNFFASPRRAMTIAEIFARRRLPWGTHGLTPRMATRLDDDTLADLRATGLTELKIGLENVSPDSMRVMGKVFDPVAFRDFNSRLARFGIPVQYSVILGFPGETLDSIRENVLYVLALLCENPNASLFLINLLFPYPGTPLYEKYTGPAWRNAWSLERYGSFEINDRGGPWLDPDRTRLLKSVSFTSIFVSPKDAAFASGLSRGIEALRRTYAPLARYRLRGLRYGFAPEVRLGRALLNLTTRYVR